MRWSPSARAACASDPDEPELQLLSFRDTPLGPRRSTGGGRGHLTPGRRVSHPDLVEAYYHLGAVPGRLGRPEEEAATCPDTAEDSPCPGMRRPWENSASPSLARACCPRRSKCCAVRWHCGPPLPRPTITWAWAASSTGPRLPKPRTACGMAHARHTGLTMPRPISTSPTRLGDLVRRDEALASFYQAAQHRPDFAEAAEQSRPGPDGGGRGQARLRSSFARPYGLPRGRRTPRHLATTSAWPT